MRLKPYAERGDVVTFYYHPGPWTERVLIRDAIVTGTIGSWFDFTCRDGSTGRGNSENVIFWRRPSDADLMVGGAL